MFFLNVIKGHFWDTIMSIGEIIQKYRKEHDLSGREMARILGCHHSTLYRIECGESRPNVHIMRKLSTLTGIDFDELVDSSYVVDGIKPKKDEIEILHAYRHASPVLQQAVRDILHIKNAPSD